MNPIENISFDMGEIPNSDINGSGLVILWETFAAYEMTKVVRQVITEARGINLNECTNACLSEIYFIRPYK